MKVRRVAGRLTRIKASGAKPFRAKYSRKVPVEVAVERSLRRFKHGTVTVRTMADELTRTMKRTTRAFGKFALAAKAASAAYETIAEWTLPPR